MASRFTELNFALGEDIDLLRAHTREFARREIEALADRCDEENAFPHEVWRKLGDAGLLGITVSEEYGGAGMGYLAHVVAMEELSRASASIAGGSSIPPRSGARPWSCPRTSGCRRRRRAHRSSRGATPRRSRRAWGHNRSGTRKSSELRALPGRNSCEFRYCRCATGLELQTHGSATIEICPAMG